MNKKEGEKMAIQHTNLNTSQSILDDLTRFKGEYNDIYRDPFIGGNMLCLCYKTNALF